MSFFSTTGVGVDEVSIAFFNSASPTLILLRFIGFMLDDDSGSLALAHSGRALSTKTIDRSSSSASRLRGLPLTGGNGLDARKALWDALKGSPIGETTFR